MRDSVLKRASAIMHAFSELGQSTLMLENIVNHTGLPKATAYRICSQLVEEGWLSRQTATQGYSLNPKAVAYGLYSDDFEHLREVAYPVLRDLHTRTHFTAQLAVLENNGMIRYIDVMDFLVKTQVPSAVGLRYPLELTAAGRAILSQMDDDKVETYLKARNETGRAILNKLRRELPKINQNSGVATKVSLEEHGELFVVAAPVLNADGRAIAAVCLAGREARMNIFQSDVLAASKMITNALHESAEL